MTKRLIAPALVLVFIAILGLVTRQDRETTLFEQTISVCEASYQVVDGNLETKCGQLIDEVQQDSRHEVMSRDGQFWIEVKGTNQ